MHTHRTVIRTHYVWHDEGFFKVGAKVGGDTAVIDAPSHVPCPCSRAVTPPGIMSTALFKFAKGVDKTCIDQLGERCTFLRTETGVFCVVFGAGKVDFLMSDVQIATEKDRFLLL